MTVTIEGITYQYLQAQPIGYQETDVAAGLVAPSIALSGLLTPAEWGGLLSTHNAWLQARKTEAPSIVTGTVGTTVAVQAIANGVDTGVVASWFTASPSATQAGAYLQVAAQFVDAAAQLEIDLLSEEKTAQTAQVGLGTITLGSAVITLDQPPESFANPPQTEPSAAGFPVITGPAAPWNQQVIVGHCDATNLANLQSWYLATVATTPTTGQVWPTVPPTASAVNEVVAGVRQVRYDVNLTTIVVP